MSLPGLARTRNEITSGKPSILKLRKAGAEDPGFAESWAVHLSRELHATRLRAEVLSLRTVRERLDAWIAWNGESLPTKSTWKTVANEIGTSPEALYRELARRRCEAPQA